VKVTEAYGISARRISNAGEVAEALRWLWSDPLAPMLLEVDIASTANVYPKMAFGRPITEMEPFFKSNGMEGT
jgi:acetolactate synthase-1/2/3 large subunit